MPAIGVLQDNKAFLSWVRYSYVVSVTMDKKTKTQFSLGFFAVGFLMLFVPDLKHLDAIPIGISQFFSIMFYLGLIFIVIGYYLK